MMMTRFALAAAAVLLPSLAQAQDYGGPPGGSDAYGYARYDGASCGGFTIAGAHAGITVLGISVGAGARARAGEDCPRAAPPAPPVPAAYGPEAYAPSAPAPYPAYAPAYAPPGYSYALPSYPVEQVWVSPPYSYAPSPCGCVPTSP
jgi:hypothetical protein